MVDKNLEVRACAYSVTEFCKIYGLGRTRAYAEIGSGRLKAKKIGRRTVVPAEAAEEWLSRLPDYRSRDSSRRDSEAQS